MDRDTLNTLMLITVGSVMLLVVIIEPILWAIKVIAFFRGRWNNDTDAPEPWKTAQAIDDDELIEADEEL
jgi:hypothetical protein